MGDPAKASALPDNTAVDSFAATCAEKEAAPAASPAAASGERELPRRIGRYVVLRHLGQGGMGVVFAAYDEELARKLAVKLLHHAELASSDRRTRIFREAQAMARVSHPNVVQVYEVGETAGQVFIAMEFIEGTTLGSWQKQRERPWDEVLRMYLAAGEGLLAAHRVGLVHRDFKPDNVLVDNDQRPRVADFGLARRAGSVEPEAAPAEAAVSPIHLLDSPLTVTGTLLGTPAYMSPEQYGGEPADSRSDQFSFCAALYEALYKKLPFAGRTLAELSANVLGGRLQPVPADSPVPMLIAEALRRGLSTRPEQRFPSMAELLQALAINPQHHPAGAPRIRRIFTALLLLLTFSISVGINLSKSHGGLGLRQFLWAALSLLLGGSAAAWLMRDALGQNTFHRRMVLMMIAMAAQMVGMRTVSLLLGLTMAQHGALEMMALCATVLIVATQFLPAVWPVTLLLGGGAVVLTQRPDLLWPVLPVCYPIMGLALVLSWNRAARHGPRPSS